MSIATYIASIEADRNTIRNKVVELGLAQSVDKLNVLAQAIADIKGLTYEEVVSRTEQNGKELFGI